MTVLLLTDLLNSRARKQKELLFYTEQKEALERKLFDIRRELNLTDRILRMIRKEEITEIGKCQHS
jgi:hypothetical protein